MMLIPPCGTIWETWLDASCIASPGVVVLNRHEAISMTLGLAEVPLDRNRCAVLLQCRAVSNSSLALCLGLCDCSAVQMACRGVMVAGWSQVDW